MALCHSFLRLSRIPLHICTACPCLSKDSDSQKMFRGDILSGSPKKDWSGVKWGGGEWGEESVLSGTGLKDLPPRVLGSRGWSTHCCLDASGRRAGKCRSSETKTHALSAGHHPAARAGGFFHL